MTVRFRTARYLLALLWHWSVPFMLGAVTASVVASQGILATVELIDQSFDGALQRTVASCSTAAPETAEISGATRSLFPLARGPTSPPGALVLALPSDTRP
tara:strand:- start:7288 stop:7590 length:303 start_codon:yes stop_codon:yes gene_type:complete